MVPRPGRLRSGFFATRMSLSSSRLLPTSSSRRTPGSSASPLRRTAEAGFVAASYLPVCSCDRAACAAGVSNTCRRPSHFLFPSLKTLPSLRSPLHRHPGERRRRFSTAKLVIQRLPASLSLRSWIRGGLVLASYLPVFSRDLAAYAAGVSHACRRASHFLFAGPRTQCERRSRPGGRRTFRSGVKRK